jgi:hypothetical protein
MLGVPAPPIEALFAAQIAAARTVQDQVRSTPAAERPSVETMDLDGEARPALARLSDQIVERAADLARTPFAEPLPSAPMLAGALDASVTPAADRLAIARAITALLAPQ